VPSADAPALCEAIRQVAPDTKLMTRLGTNAQTLFQSHYTEEKMLDTYKQLYFDLLREKGPIEVSRIGLRNDLKRPAGSLANVVNR
jgi:hypothetical protein